jgi:AbrB family looped-hinge helix DNA binding protein
MRESRTLFTTVLTERGTITIPQYVRDALGWKPGTKLDFRVTEDQTVVIEEAVPEALIDHPDEIVEWREKCVQRVLQLFGK